MVALCDIATFLLCSGVLGLQNGVCFKISNVIEILEDSEI